jgi:hypothetical protein
MLVIIYDSVVVCIWLLYFVIGVLPSAGSWGPPMRHP